MEMQINFINKEIFIKTNSQFSVAITWFCVGIWVLYSGFMLWHFNQQDSTQSKICSTRVLNNSK